MTELPTMAVHPYLFFMVLARII